MHDSALDFIIFIIIFVVASVFSVNAIIPLTKESKELVYDEQYDKTVQKLQGEKVEIIGDGSMSIEEITLQIMGQSYFMPAPRKIRIGTDEYDIVVDKGFTPTSKSFGTPVYQNIENWANSFRTKDIVAINNYLNDYNLELADNVLPLVKDMRFLLLYDNGPDEGKEDPDNPGRIIRDDSFVLTVRLTCRDLTTLALTDKFLNCTDGGFISARSDT